jgi:hypothetical protein
MSSLLTPGTQDLSPEALRALTRYMAEPSLEAFRLLTQSTQDDERSVLTDLFYSLVGDLHSSKARHLAEALAVEGRLLEALHVLQRWSTRHPLDREASRTAAILAVKTTHLVVAEAIANDIVEDGGIESTKTTLLAMVALRRNEAQRFAGLLADMLEARPIDQLVPSVATEMAIRMGDPVALLRVVHSFGAEKCLKDLGGRQSLLAQRLLRRALVDVLGRRPAGAL